MKQLLNSIVLLFVCYSSFSQEKLSPKMATTNQSLPGINKIAINPNTFNYNPATGIRCLPSYREPLPLLYIIDGVPYDGELLTINPNDIERIEILKDACTPAILCCRGPRAVVIVTTKKSSLAKTKTLAPVTVKSYSSTKRRCPIVCQFPGYKDVRSCEAGAGKKLNADKLGTNSLMGVKTYPNPVQRGNKITVSIQVTTAGIYSIRVVDAVGRLMVQKKSVVAAFQHNEQLSSSLNWTAGIYYIQVFNEQNKLIHTSPFMVK